RQGRVGRCSGIPDRSTLSYAGHASSDSTASDGGAKTPDGDRTRPAGLSYRGALARNRHPVRTESNMATPDASAVAQLALRLHLVTDDQLRDCWEEVSPGVHDPHALLRVL